MSESIGFPAFPPMPPGYRRPGPHPNGSAATSARRTPDKSKDYVSALRHQPPGLPRVLDTVIDDVQRTQGPYVYEAMDLDPACKAAKRTLILSILAGGMDLAPADKPEPGTKDEERTPDQVKAAEFVEEAWRHIERLEDFEETLVDLLGACVVGSKLARPVMELAKDGEDAGKLVLKALTVKPRDVWKFVVDDFMNVTDIETTDDAGQKVRYKADGFLWLTWDKTDNDPRGRSIYRAANEAWNLKYLNFPEYNTYLHQFASGMITGETAEGEQDRAEVDPYTGLATGEMITAQQYMAQELGGLGNGRVFVGPNGSKVNIVFPSGDGAPFISGFDWSDRQIFLAILGSPSANLEAEHDSRAKGQTGMDILSLEAERGRKSLAALVRRLLRMIFTLNHGPDGARLTPLVTFGQTDGQNKPELITAYVAAGYQLGDSQLDEADQVLGMPTRDKAADEAKAKQAADEAMERQAALKPPPADGGKPGDGAPPKGKPNGKPKPKAKAKPAEFAAEDYGATMAGPWHHADWVEAMAILSRNVPSAAALARWRDGELDDASRHALLDYIADDGKALLTMEGRALATELRPFFDADRAEFASPFDTLLRWRDGVARTLRRYYLAGTLALLGPGELTPADWEVLRRENEVQVDYLGKFASKLASGGHPLDGTVGSNAGLYGQSIRVVAQAVERQKAMAMGMTMERRVHVGDPSDMCPECKTEQAKKWQPIGTLKAIGKCLCKTGCHCHMEYR